MPAFVPNATANTVALGFAQADGFVVGEKASNYGVRDLSPAFGAGDLSPASLSGTGAEGFSETSSDGAFFEDNASIPHTAINRLRESGDESPHSITGRVVSGTSRRRRNISRSEINVL
ncbi:MAG: hypothetical protein LBD14_06830, partial [Puniceicoccales bacterium]|nr:hypothetical protein [Puniceicoccales bacterium]